MLFWIILVALGVALGILLAALVIVVVGAYAREILYAGLVTFMVGYVAFFYLGFTRGWFGAALTWAAARLSGL